MVFTNLGANEKDAFFSLLDEYFASRPEIFGNSEAESSSSGAASAAAAARNALAANPEATSKFISGGLRSVGQGLPKSSPYSAAASNPDIANAVGRLGAAAASSPPPILPRRGTSETQSPSTPSSNNTTANLKSVRTFGSNVDTTSAKGMFSSIRNSGKGAKGPPLVPSALAPAPNKWGPPPPRGVATPPSQEEPEPEPEEEEEEEAAQGEWAEALYDYDSTDPGDLRIRANQNVWVTERTSDDWWTGEFEGKTGLFPASYVKIL
ncbi:SH3-domain-containing protein [Mycena sanguinolenta]|nr:SH3-domain-containing protein [Mycena sanguinolenta]